MKNNLVVIVSLLFTFSTALNAQNLELSSTAPISNQNTVTLDTDITVTFDSPVKTSKEV